MKEYCEACRTNEVEVVHEETSPSLPYRLCSLCHSRLTTFSLRPLEYFNLVAIHGHGFELHDDFYDDSGIASQPKAPVEFSDNLAFPKLIDLRTNLTRLIDYATVRWWYPKEATEYLSTFSKNEILKELDHRLERNPRLLERFLEIVSEVLSLKAGDWVQFQYKSYTGDEPLIFTRALAHCLPPGLGFEIVKNILADIEPSRLHASVWVFHHFNSPETLKWIEENCYKIKNITTHYGEVCAASQFDWATAKKWIRMGRPLSLIALDALLACGTTNETLNRVLYLRERPPKLINPDTIENMNKLLEEYLKTDNVHRPRSIIGAIKGDWIDILK